MFEKLKIKYNSFFNFSKIPALATLIVIVAFLVVPKLTLAKDIAASSVSIELGVSDNFYRIEKNGSASVKVSLKLNSPDEIKLGKDFTVSDKLTRAGSGDPISGIRVGVLNKSQNDSLCQNVGSVLGGVAGSSTYDCNFTYTTASWPNWSLSQVFLGTTESWKKGQTISFDVSLSASDLQKMGATYSDQGVLNELYFYADFYLPLSNKNTAFTPAKSVFIQGFNTAQQVADAQSQPRPVDGNGTVTSSPNQKPGNDLGVASLINQIIGVFLGFFQELIYQVFFYLIAPLIQAVLSIQVYTDTFAAVIYPGWEVVRNICNIFFVVALIVIALATLFRVDSYQFRSLLVQLILAALLVNFSLVIAQAILGLADTIQAQFLPSNVEVIRSLAKDLMVKTYRDVYFTNAFSEGSFSGIVKPLFFLALAMGSFAVFAAIAVFLVIRIVALWVLLLISPMAYAVGVLPSTAGYRKQWWDMFLKYAFFTPIMAFFLNLTAVIANTYNTNPILQQINSPELQAELGGSEIATFVFKVASNILLLVFLMAALKVADMAGIYGASAITSVAQKGILAPFAGAGMVSGKLAQAYSKFTAGKAYRAKLEGRTGSQFLWSAAQMANPTVLKKGWEAYKHEKEMDAYDPGGGDVRDFLNRYIPTNYHWGFNKHAKGMKKLVPWHDLGQKTDYGKVARTTVTGHKRSELEKAPLSEEQKVKFGLGLHHAGDIAAWKYIIMDGRHEDGDMITRISAKRDELGEEYKKQLKGEHPEWDEMTLENTAKSMAAKEILPYYDPIEYVDLITEDLKHAGYTDEEIATELVYLTEYAEGENKERAFGYYLNEWDGKDRAMNDFSGYEGFEKKYGSAELLKKVLSETNDNGLDVFSRDGQGNLLFKPTLFDGSPVLDENGQQQEYTITNYQDLKNVMDKTHKLNWVNRKPVDDQGNYDAKAKLKFHGNGIADLRYVMMGARKAMDAGKRLKRGNSEDKFAMTEPAVENIQYEGGYYGTNPYSMFKAHSIPRNLAYKLPNMRRFQGRNMYILGLRENPEGRTILDDASINNNGTDYKTMSVKLASSPSFYSGLLQSMGFNTQELKKIRDELNKPDPSGHARARDRRIVRFKVAKGGPGDKPWIQPVYEGEPLNGDGLAPDEMTDAALDNLR